MFELNEGVENCSTDPWLSNANSPIKVEINKHFRCVNNLNSV